MKKYMFLIAIAVGTMAMATSCGGNSKAEGEQAEVIDGVEEVADDATVAPPFTVTAFLLREGGYKERVAETYTYEIKPNGTYTLTVNEETARTDDNAWKSRDGYPRTFTGKWTSTYRQLGDNKQKVYEIHRQAFGAYEAHSDFIPDDFEYVWIPSSGNVLDGAASWPECKNMDTRNATKVAEYTTTNGTTVIVPTEERYPVVDEEPRAYDLEGKTFQHINSESTLKFTATEVTYYDSKTNETVTGPYKYSGNSILITPLDTRGTVIPPMPGGPAQIITPDRNYNEVN